MHLHRHRRTIWHLLLLVLVITLFVIALPLRAESLDQSGQLWSPVLEWTLEDPEFDEGSNRNPYDVAAYVTFEHQESGETRRTGMFYAGGNHWKFRFTGTRTGTWVFETTSESAQLDARQGKVEITPAKDADSRGFIVAAKSRFARQVGEEGELEGFVPNVYMNFRKYGDSSDCGWTDVTRTFADREVLDAYLDEAEQHGCNAIQALIGYQWFRADVASSRDAFDLNSGSVPNPDAKTFAALELAIQAAHRRGMHVHIWAWGDEQRRWTPVRAGGINGTADRRMQRYLAARLGPLPGWTMCYGFDLEEWVTSDQVQAWQEHLQQEMGWSHLLGARAAGRFEPPETLDILAHDLRPRDRFHESAAELLQQANGRPVILEHRFAYLRNGIWDMDTTRRALWQFTLAGGVGAIWGHYPPNCAAYVEGEYPHPEQMRTHRQFWRHRFGLDLEPVPRGANSSAGGLAGDQERLILYQEETDTVDLPLATLHGLQRGVAVDTRKDYEEIDLGQLQPEDQTWQAPYSSDWAIAVGEFPLSQEIKKKESP